MDDWGQLLHAALPGVATLDPRHQFPGIAPFVEQAGLLRH